MIFSSGIFDLIDDLPKDNLKLSLASYNLLWFCLILSVKIFIYLSFRRKIK